MQIVCFFHEAAQYVYACKMVCVLGNRFPDVIIDNFSIYSLYIKWLSTILSKFSTICLLSLLPVSMFYILFSLSTAVIVQESGASNYISTCIS